MASITMEVAKHIESTGYTPGSAGFRIKGDGDAEFNNVTIRGTLVAVEGTFRELHAGVLQNASTSPTAAIRLSSSDALPASADTYIDMAGSGGMTFAGVAQTLTAPGTGLSKTLRIAPSLLVPINSSQVWNTGYDYSYPGQANTEVRFVATAILPAGVTITGVAARLYRQTTSDTAVVELYRANESTAPSLLGTMTHSSTGWQDLTISGLSETVGSLTYAFLVRMTGVASHFDARCKRLEINYLMPSYDKSL